MNENQHPYRKQSTPTPAPASTTSTETPISLSEFMATQTTRGFYSGQTKFAPSTEAPRHGWHGNAARVFEVQASARFATRPERYTKTSILEDELMALEAIRADIDDLIKSRKRELDGLERTQCSPGLTCSCGRVFENELEFANHFPLTQGPNLKNLGECPVPDSQRGYLCTTCFESKWGFEPDADSELATVGVVSAELPCTRCGAATLVTYKNTMGNN